MANLLDEERIHVMFGFQQDEQKKPIGLFHELARIPLACVCSAGHPYAGRTCLNVDELEGPIVLGEPHRLPPYSSLKSVLPPPAILRSFSLWIPMKAYWLW